MHKLAKNNVTVEVFSDAAELGEALAREIFSGLAASQKAGRKHLIGCPSGRSLKSTYDALGRQAAQVDADLSSLVIVMMDDYVFHRGKRFEHCPADAHYSCRRFAREEIQEVLNAGVSPSHRLPLENIWLPDASDPAEYDRRLSKAGGIDLLLAASGATDGHVAFNPPETSFDSSTRIIELSERTRCDNMSTFPQFESLDEVPLYGVSVGLGTISTLSREVVMVIHGQHKAEAVRQLFSRSDFDPTWPASFIYGLRATRVMLDESAAAGLEKAM